MLNTPDEAYLNNESPNPMWPATNTTAPDDAARLFDLGLSTAAQTDTGIQEFVDQQAGEVETPTSRVARPAAGVRFVPPTAAQLGPLFPQFSEIELIGAGGMGAVYRGRQREIDRVVAIKILPSPTGVTVEAFRDRFTREARAMARLSHPNIVALYDFGRTAAGTNFPDGLYYIVMEHVEGTNLRTLLRSRRLEPREALAIVAQICDALQYAHDEGVVHRDIKPENLLIDKRGKVKMADFGLAKLADDITGIKSLTITGRTMGTPRYMAPEQATGAKHVDHRADIYSLGVVLYELLTGELPLGAYPLPSQRTAVDSRLDEIVRRTLEKTPELRYQRASEVRTDVQIWSDSSESHASNPTTAVQVQAGGWSGRRLLASVAVIVAALVAIGLVGPALWQNTPADDKTASSPSVPAIPPPLAPDNSKSKSQTNGSAAGSTGAAPAPLPTTGPAPPPLDFTALPEADRPKAAADSQKAWADHYRMPVKHRLDAGGVPIEVVVIPPGIYSTNGTNRFFSPDPFQIGVHEVTRGQFAAFVKETGYRTQAERAGKANRFTDDGGWGMVAGANWQRPGFEQTDEHPVVSISWNDAMAYCRWLSGKVGRQVRLPSEVEWSHAARAGITTEYLWGKSHEIGQGWANIGDDGFQTRYPKHPSGWGWNDGFVETAPIGSFKPNSFGLYDAIGNVNEWMGAPHWMRDEGNPRFRGGGWPSPVRWGRFEAAASSSASYTQPDVGFRIAITLRAPTFQLCKIALENSNMVLTLDTTSTSASPRMIVAPDNGAPAQRWLVTPALDHIQLFNVQAGKVLDVQNGQNHEGLPLIVYANSGSDNQLWSWVGDGPARRLRSKRSGLVMQAGPVGTVVQMKQSDESTGQLWRIVVVD